MSSVDRRLPLILPSNPPPPELSDSEEPRLDYRELSVTLGCAPLLHPPAGNLPDMRQAIEAWRRRKSVGAYVSLSERIGLPLAMLAGRRPRIPHILVAHNLTSERKRLIQARTGWLRRFSRIVVLCREQERYLVEESGLPPERVRFLYDKVDERFWKPAGSADFDIRGREYILSVGSERRDYATLCGAARMLPELRFVIVADSLWSRQSRAAGSIADSIPNNVCIESRLSFTQLRERYKSAQAVVVPLDAGTRTAAGVNAVLEAMAMAKALVVSATPGISDYVGDTVNARVVPPADPAALAAAIRAIASDPIEAARLGANARAVVDGGRNLDSYVAGLAAVVREAMGIRA